MPKPPDPVQLRRWHQQLDPERALDLSESDQRDRYVALDAWTFEGHTYPLRGPAPVTSILRSLRMTAEIAGAASAHLFAGFRGTGKTTELSRLTRELREHGGFAVLHFSARDYHHMSDSLSVEELAVMLAAGIGEQALEVLGDERLPAFAKEGVWNRIGATLSGLFRESGLELRFGPVALKPALRQGESLKADLRAALRERPNRLQEFLHGFVREVADAIHPRQLVIVVDDLEKFDARSDRVDAVYREMADLFLHSPHILKIPNCHVIYTVPPYLALINRAISNVYGGRLHILPSIKVRSPPPEHVPHEAGIAALQAVIDERVDLDVLFGGEREVCMRRLILASGGNLRDLFHLVRELLEAAQDLGLPIAPSEVEQAIRRQAAHRMIFRKEFELLRDVRRRGDLTDVDDEQRGGFAEAMDQQLMLCYWNGRLWYDAHPLVEAQLDREEPSEA